MGEGAEPEPSPLHLDRELEPEPSQLRSQLAEANGALAPFEVPQELCGEPAEVSDVLLGEPEFLSSCSNQCRNVVGPLATAGHRLHPAHLADHAKNPPIGAFSITLPAFGWVGPQKTHRTV